MNRIDRLTAILVHLQGKPRIPLEELECRFGVSRRTIFRDIKSLLEAGVPIGGDAGEGYFIVEGYHLPPVVFNKEEAAAMLLGAKLIEKQADSQVSSSFREAMYKIKAVLRYSDKEYLDNLEDNISVMSSPLMRERDFPDSHISEIEQALANSRKIHISYFSNYNEQTTERCVEPLGLVYYSGRWHLIAYCHLRKDMRDFRTDRIQKLVLSSETYNRKGHPKLEDFLNQMIGGTDAKEAVIKVSRKIARFIQEQKFYYGFISEKKVADGFEMKFVTPYYEHLGRWLLMYGNEINIIAPTRLQELMATFSKELYEHHKKQFNVAQV